jgi:hypothetical protein
MNKFLLVLFVSLLIGCQSKKIVPIEIPQVNTPAPSIQPEISEAKDLIPAFTVTFDNISKNISVIKTQVPISNVWPVIDKSITDGISLIGKLNAIIASAELKCIQYEENVKEVSNKLAIQDLAVKQAKDLQTKAEDNLKIEKDNTKSLALKTTNLIFSSMIIAGCTGITGSIVFFLASLFGWFLNSKLCIQLAIFLGVSGSALIAIGLLLINYSVLIAIISGIVIGLILVGFSVWALVTHKFTNIINNLETKG